MINFSLKLIGLLLCVLMFLKGIRMYRHNRDSYDAYHLLCWAGCCLTGAGVAVTGERFVQQGMTPMAHIAYNAILNVLILAVIYHGVGLTLSITGLPMQKLRSCKIAFGLAFVALLIADGLYRLGGFLYFSKAYRGILTIACGFYALKIIYWYHTRAKKAAALTKWRMHMNKWGSIICLFYPVSLLPGAETWMIRPNLVLFVVVCALFRLGSSMPQWLQRFLIALEMGTQLLRQHLLLVGLISDFYAQGNRADRRKVELWINRFAFALDFSEIQRETLVRALYLANVGRLGGQRENIEIKHAMDRDSVYPALPPSVDAEFVVREESSNFVEEMLGWGQVSDILRHTTERWDGTGYPDGLEGQEIPIESRILALVEKFVEKLEKTGNTQEAIALIRKEAGKSFDPQLVSLLESTIS